MLYKKKIKYKKKIVQTKRVTKVTKGGKKMTFRIILILGTNFKKVGLGIGHSKDTFLAMQKAIRNAKKNLIQIPVTKLYSISKSLIIKYKACKIKFYPASYGKGIIANKNIRTILQFCGIKNIITKQLGSNNILNNIKATFLALILLKKFNNYKKIEYL